MSIERKSEGSALPCEVLAEFLLSLLNVTVRSAAAADAAAAALMIDRRRRTNADAANACIRCDYDEITERCNETSMRDCFCRKRNLLLAGIAAEQGCGLSFGGFGHASCRHEGRWKNVARVVCLRTAWSRFSPISACHLPSI